MNRFRHILFILTTSVSGQILAQNLVPNPSFEDYTVCPTSGNQGEPLECIPWTQGNTGSADYFNVCASPGNVGVPNNFAGNQSPVSGVAYTGAYARTSEPSYREYVQAPLDNPLVVGTAYLVSFYISPGEELCVTKPFGALFTVDTPAYNGFFGYSVLDYTPQIEVNGEYLNDYNDWTLISRCFVAEGGENYITIGNFRDDDETPIEPGCNGTSTYYYIDHVSVEAMPLSEDVFELDPVVTCDSFEIFPGQAQNYTWSDGTTLPTLTVYESGTYYVTLSDECAFQYGEIEVTIIPGMPPVVLPGDTVLCAGETLDISLDPDLGDYLWQDGYAGPDYTIATEGTYIVTLTEFCDMTTDTIQVSYLDIPQPFSLGEDTLICDGDAFTIAFDPALGDFVWQDGSSNSSFTIDDDGTYALTISNMCGQTDDEIAVEFIEALDFSIGPDQAILCAGESIEITLDPTLGDFLWHDSSTGNSYTVTNEGLVSVQVTNACETASDEMLVNVLLPPQFTLGPDLTVCEGQFPLTFDFSDVDHAQDYEWTDGSGQSVYQITAPGIYGLTISNDCFAETDSIEITVADADPVVMLPPDQLLCPGDSMLLDAGGVQGDYVWLTSTGSVTDTVSTASNYIASDSGTYVLQVTNICGTGADTIVIEYSAMIQAPDLGADFSLCPGETAVLYANVSGVSYAWQDTSTGSVSDADSLLVTGPGVYVLEIADQCTTASDTVVVTQDGNPPVVDLPETIQLCEGDTVVLEAGVSGVEYLWQDISTGSMTTGSQFIVTLPGIYSLQASNACGTDSDTTIVLDSGPAPFVELGADTALCQGDVIVLMPDYSDVESWLWNDSSVATQFIASMPGTYHVDVSNQCGQASDTIVLTDLGPAPVVELGADTAICPGDALVLMPTASDVESWLWNDSSVATQFIASMAGIYHVQVSNVCGQDSDTIIISDLGPPPTVNLGPDIALCPGETITLIPEATDVLTWMWQDSSVATQFIASMAGTYHVQVSNDCGTASDTIEIILDPNGPQVDLGPDVLACEGDTVVLDAGISGVDYLWTDPAGGVSTSSTTAATLSGVYHLEVSNACGMDTDTILVDIHGMEPTPSLGPDTTLCEDEVLTLVSDADAETMIEWVNVATGTVVSTSSTTAVSSSGTYILAETNHCGVASDTIVIDFDSAPAAFDLGEDMVICPGDTVTLHAPSTDDAILWETSEGASTSSATTVAQPGLVTLSISNDCGIASDEIFIAFDPNEPKVALDPVALCEGESFVLDVTQPFDADYLWNTGSTSSVLQVVEAGDYHVSVMTDCYLAVGSAGVTESDDCDPQIYIPNVFSPNYDNVNDVWEVRIDPGLEFTSIECRVFDRWGNTVFGTASVPIVWDGSFKGSAVLPGVYVYVVRLIDEDEIQMFSGSLTMIK